MKKRLWITSLLAALSITAVAGGVAVANDKAVVTEAATWQIEELDSNTYEYGKSFTVPAATVEIGGKTVNASATVTYPDGLTVATQNVALNQAGVYTITYRAEVDGIPCVEEKQFTVSNKGYVMQNAVSSAEYGTYTKYGSNSKGLLVRLAQGDTLTFSQLLDMNEITGTDNIIDLFVTPDQMASYDFSKLVIRLTDAVDSSKYLQFQLRRYNAEDRGFAWGYLDASVNGQPWVGYEKGYRHNGWGTPFTFTFNAAMNTQNGAMAWFGDVKQLTPDKNTCKISYNPVNMEVRVSNSHIANLNNVALFEEIWTGFPSGKAKLTLTAEEVKGETANFCIKSVYGIDISDNTFTENEAPVIDVSMSDDEMPQGEVGFAYTIPSASAYDLYSGVCDTTVSVYRDYAEERPISVGVANGKFKPTVAGWHTIVYTAKDALGNEGKVLRNVYVADDLGEIEINVPEDKATDANLGNWVNVPAITYTGDCGITDVKTTVTFGNDTYEISDKFLPEVAGDYIVTYTVTDYIGRVGEASYVVTAVATNDYIILENPVLPQIYLSDCEYTLPTIYAKNYATGKAEETLCDVVVTDKNGEKTYKAGSAFKPSVAVNGEKVKVSYQCGGQVLYEEEVPTVLVKSGDSKAPIIGENYLYGEGFTISKKDANGKNYSAGIEIIANEASELCGWTFATPQLMNNFEIDFEGLAAKTNFEALKITLTDSLNKNEEISLLLGVKAKGTTMVCGENTLDVSDATLVTNKAYTVSYKNGKFSFSGSNISATKTVNGEAFTGFSSNLAYVRVEMVNAKAGASYKLRSVNGSNISYRNLEKFNPNFQILGDFGGNQSLNSVYEIYPAIANDVFAPNTSITMTVFAPDGTVMEDNDGVRLENVATDKSYFITMSEIGKYQISYTAVEKDWVVSNPMNITESVYVVDETAPQVAFKNATQTTAEVGDVIVCPDVIFQDNYATEETVRIVTGVYNPNGKFFLFEGEENAIKCAFVGEYKFIAMVFDEFGNMNSVTHTITVTAKEV